MFVGQSSQRELIKKFYLPSRAVSVELKLFADLQEEVHSGGVCEGGGGSAAIFKISIIMDQKEYY